MEESRNSDYLFAFMKNLNLITIFYISILIAYGLYGVIQEQSALDFLGRIDAMPAAGWKIPVLALGLYCSCLLLFQIQNKGVAGLVIKVCMELGIGFCICFVTGFSYTGVILLVLADMMRNLPRSKWRVPFAVLISMFYLLIDYNLISILHHVTPLEIYLDYFQKDIRFLLLGIKNTLNSLNMLLFLVYMILLMRIQLSEKERILHLNETLNHANEELRLANIQLEQYARESEKAAEARERNRLAREIHDTLGHALTGIITGIEACTVLMDVAPDATKAQLNAIAEMARQGVSDVRSSVNALRPDALEKLDLEKALTQMIDEMCRSTNVEIVYQCNTRLNCFDEDEENIIYRIVQECITNSIRHGKAKNIQIQIDKEYNMLKLQITDNGIGCDTIKKGFGLHHMEERLDMLRGSLRYSGENGFTVEAQIPIRWGTEEQNDD